jgi:hypothetical protein
MLLTSTTGGYFSAPRVRAPFGTNVTLDPSEAGPATVRCG